MEAVDHRHFPEADDHSGCPAVVGVLVTLLNCKLHRGFDPQLQQSVPTSNGLQRSHHCFAICTGSERALPDCSLLAFRDTGPRLCLRLPSTSHWAFGFVAVGVSSSSAVGKEHWSFASFTAAPPAFCIAMGSLDCQEAHPQISSLFQSGDCHVAINATPLGCLFPPSGCWGLGSLVVPSSFGVGNCLQRVPWGPHARKYHSQGGAPKRRIGGSGSPAPPRPETSLGNPAPNFQWLLETLEQLSCACGRSLAFVGGLILLSCRNLLLTLEIPKPVRGFRELEGPLKRLRLFSDLVRGALFFWQHGLPAVLILPPVACPAVDAVTRAAPHTQRRNGLLVLANSVIPEGLINRLTS